MRLIALDVTKEVGKNSLMAVPFVRTWRLTKPRAGQVYDGSEAQLRRYVFDLLDIVETATGGLKGKRIAEIGAGDFLSAALAFLASGAKTYASIDRFVGDYGRPDAKTWYVGVRDNWTQHTGKIWPTDLDPTAFPEAYADRVQTINKPIETAEVNEKFDVVCSMSVGEHVSDIDGFARANARLLAPGGTAVHRIDFGPHDVWRTSYDDPQLFLRFPRPLWRMMGSTRGYPNRRRLHEIVEAFERAGLSVAVTDVETFDDMAPDRLPPRMRSMPPESLATKSATISASKP